MGKTTLIKSLVKHYTRHNLSSVKGPITVVSGKQRRLQLVECGPDLCNMVRAHARTSVPNRVTSVLTPHTCGPPQIDAAKFADLVLLLIDGNFGFEMETFEFLNILQARAHSLVGAAAGSRADVSCLRAALRCTASPRLWACSRIWTSSRTRQS